MGEESSSLWAGTGRRKLGGAREPEGRRAGGQEPTWKGRKGSFLEQRLPAMAQAMWTAPRVNQAPSP